MLLGAALTCLTVAGCFRGDWWMYVTNETDEAVHLRVQEKPGSPDIYHVARVEPGADGPGVTWVGERDVPVEVLGAACQLIGVLRTLDGTQYFVEELPGLTAHIEEWHVVPGNQTPGIEDTRDCGGS